MGLLDQKTNARSFEALSVKPQTKSEVSSKKLRGSRRLKKSKGDEIGNISNSSSNVTGPHLIAQESNQ